MGGAFPQHLISSQHLGKEDINKLLENKKDKDNMHPIVCGQEVKIAAMCFQNVEEGVSPMQVISSRSQTKNEASEFTNDVCKAYKKITKEMEGTTFSHWAADRASVETNDIITTLCHFLDG